ncbi:MAG: hypothetical protein A2X04_02420 [Bacteroidetes bacterium GWF2_41_9]|nr:MAG: hypothetical protein A2X04_02420 [Bacteroidetes bacterium GWF2_41_9]
MREIPLRHPADRDDMSVFGHWGREKRAGSARSLLLTLLKRLRLSFRIPLRWDEESPAYTLCSL